MTSVPPSSNLPENQETEPQKIISHTIRDVSTSSSLFFFYIACGQSPASGYSDGGDPSIIKLAEMHGSW
jgi:hypothetical protein